MTTAILIILLAALTLYVVFGGADFGAGIWEFNTLFRSSEREREMIHHAIGPVWETNHVWLIYVMVLLFGAFPPAFAAINQAIFVPLLLALVGIVFRGAAYAFRTPVKSDPAKSRIWIVAFAFASVLAPLFLGAGVGAIASGKLPFDDAGNFAGDYWFGWVNSLSIFCGFFTVGLCAYASATYMIRESRQSLLETNKLPIEDPRRSKPELECLEMMENLWRKRALFVGSLMGVLALAGLLLLALEYEELWNGMKARGWPAILISIVSGLFSLWAIYHRKVNMATIGASITSATVVIGWGLAQYPFIIPPAWSAADAASPDVVLKIILYTSAIGSAFLIPSLILLFKIFKSDSH